MATSSKNRLPANAKGKPASAKPVTHSPSQSPATNTSNLTRLQSPVSKTNDANLASVVSPLKKTGTAASPATISDPDHPTGPKPLPEGKKTLQRSAKPRTAKHLSQARKKTSSKMPTRGAMVINLHRYDGGVLCADIVYPNNPDRQAFLGNIIKVLRSDEQMMMNYLIQGIYNKRHEDIEDDCAMKSDPKASDSNCYPFQTFVNLFCEKEQLTHEAAMEWGKQLCIMANSISKDFDEYPNDFVVGADLTKTDSEGNLLPPSTHLLNKDVMEVMDAYYSDSSREDHANYLAEQYFGSWKGAPAYIRAFPHPDGNKTGVSPGFNNPDKNNNE